MVAVPNPRDPLVRYLRVQRKYDLSLDRVLETAAEDIKYRLVRLQGNGVGNEIRRSQLRLVLREIRLAQDQLWQHDIKRVIQDGRVAGMKAAQDAVEAIERVVYASIADGPAEAVLNGINAAARAGIDAAVDRIPKDLSERVYKHSALSQGLVERTVQSGIIQGLSASEMAQSVYHLISPRTPGGISYAARRLARTEINNAFHTQQTLKAKNNPFVRQVIWKLSGSHPKPDECNDYAAKRYDPEDVPGKPHPQCLCYMTYDVMSPDEFVKAMESGKFDHLI